MKKLSRWAEEMMDKKIPEGDAASGNLHCQCSDVLYQTGRAYVF